MPRSRFFRHKMVLVLVAITIVLLLGFDIVAQIIIQTEFDERSRDSIKFQAIETVEVLKDLEDGMSLIDDSLKFNTQRSLKSHVDITLALLEGMRDEYSDAQNSDYVSHERTESTQIDVLRRVDSYRKNIDGTIAIFSLDKGILLYPEGDDGRMNIYFTAENKGILDQTIKDGQTFGAIKTSDLFQGENVFKGYFAYDKTWNWLIFAVKKEEFAEQYRSYGELITIRDGIKRAQSYSIVESAYVLDSHYFYEFGVSPEEVGRKISKIDLRTNKNIEDLYAQHMNGFVEYAIKDKTSGQVQEKLAYVLGTEDQNHIVVVEADMKTFKDMTREIILRIRLMTLIAIIALVIILYLLYENFIILIDPIAEQQGGLL